jgi:small conductance mechanosensitive channel
LQGVIVLVEQGIALLLFRQLAVVLVSWLARRAAGLPVLRHHPERVAAAALYIRRRISYLMLLLFAGAAAFDAYVLFYLRQDLVDYMRGLLPHFSSDVWRSFAKRVGAVVLVGMGIRLVSGWLRLGLAAAGKRTDLFARAQITEAEVKTLLGRLDGIRRYGAIILFAWAAALLLGAPESLIHGLSTVLRVYLIIALSRLGVIVAVLVVQGADYLAQRYLVAETAGKIHEQLRSLKPLLIRSIEYIVYVSAASLVLLQLEVTARYAAYGPRAVELIGIFLMSRVFIAVINLLLDRLLLVRRDLDDYQWQQRLTLTPLIRSVCKYAVVFTAIIIGMSVCGINTTPILAGLGGAGIIIGLGAQPVINDFVSGLFILFENVYLVGDYVEIGNARGIVEGIDVRTTRVRGDPGGEIFVLRNGQINNVISFSKAYVYAVVDIGVDYEEDLSRMFALLEQIGRDHAAKDSGVIEPARVKGVQSFAQGHVVVRMVVKAKPGQHGPVGRQYRRMVKDAFDREGIEMPFARQVIHLAGDNAAGGAAASLKTPLTGDS